MSNFTCAEPNANEKKHNFCLFALGSAHVSLTFKPGITHTNKSYFALELDLYEIGPFENVSMVNNFFSK